MKILIYDVETAQGKNIGSICAVGWISLDDSRVTGSGYSLINPQCAFSSYNTKIHGIKAADVKDAPTFAEYWESTLKDMMSDHLVIAHSAKFDISATQQALFNAGIKDPGIDYLDSLAVFRRYVETDSCKLTVLADQCGYEYNAHNALEDVKALLHVLNALAGRLDCEDLPALLIRSNVPVETSVFDSYTPREIVTEKQKKAFPGKSHCTEAVEQKGTVFCGKKFCITGDIPGFERSDIERMIMEQGGAVCGAVSGKTDFLIVGSFPDCPDDYVSTKMQKAFDIIDAGGSVKIVFPDEFFTMLRQDVLL